MSDADIRDLRRILDSLSDAVVAVDRSGLIVSLNAAAERLFALDGKTTVGHHMFAVLGDHAVAHALDGVMRGTDTAVEQVHEVQHDTQHGSIALEVTITSLRPGPLQPDESENAAEGAVAVCRDITELRQLARARHDFFANVNHELRTPLTAILGAVDVISSEVGSDSGTIQHFIGHIGQHADRLNELVSDLLILSTLEDERYQPEAETVDLGKLVREVVGELRDSAGASASIAIRVDGDVPPIAGEPRSLRFLATNLIVNAVQHGGSNAQINVEVDRSPPSPDSLGRRIVGSFDQSMPDAPYVYLMVSDSGAGISPAEHDRIFERFFRVDSSRGSEQGGTGIGLSIVKHAVLRHGGSIWLKSAPGLGSQFTVGLPVS